jgi:outer membrane protein assembly factor BamB
MNPVNSISRSHDSSKQQRRTIRPIGAAALAGITFLGDQLLAIDTLKGHLLQIDPVTDNTTILNTRQATDFIYVKGLCLWDDTLWFTQGDTVYFCPRGEFQLKSFVTLPYQADGVAVWESTVYVTSQKSGYILIYDRTTRRQITKFYAPGVGIQNITIRGEEIWISDSTEQTVYCLDRATGTIKFSVLTPFERPTGLAFHTNLEIKSNSAKTSSSNNKGGSPTTSSINFNSASLSARTNVRC